MSTRSLIGIETSDGKCRAIYCHFDGYPTGVGFELVRNYTTTTQVRKLLALGDLSSLGSTLDECDAYSRDRGEDYCAPTMYANRSKYFVDAYERDTEYCYLFSLGTWLYTDCRSWIVQERAVQEGAVKWRRADIKELDRERIAQIAYDAYCEERRRRLRNAGYAV